MSLDFLGRKLTGKCVIPHTRNTFRVVEEYTVQNGKITVIGGEYNPKDCFILDEDLRDGQTFKVNDLVLVYRVFKPVFKRVQEVHGDAVRLEGEGTFFGSSFVICAEHLRHEYPELFL